MNKMITKVALVLTAFGLMIAVPVGRSSHANSGAPGTGARQGDCSNFLPPMPNSASFKASGGTGSFSVDTGTGGGSCVWNAVSRAFWITVDPSPRTGDQTVTYTVDNNRGAQRNGFITISSQNTPSATFQFAVQQEGLCDGHVEPGGASFQAGGGSGSFDATSSGDCPLQPAPSASWVQILQVSGSTITYSVSPNTGPPRLARINPGNNLVVEPFRVEQDAIDACPASSFSLSPNSFTSDSGITDKFNFRVSAPKNCAWIPVSTADWIIAYGAGDDTVQHGQSDVIVTLYENLGATRVGTIIAGGQTFRVVQGPEACPMEEICHLFPAACPHSVLDVSHSFRDRILAKSDRGQRYTRLYYQFSREAVRIMLSNPMLLLHSRDMITRYKPVLESLVNGEVVNLTQGDLNDIDEFLGSFSGKGSAELKDALDGLRRDLGNPAVHREFKISIVEGPKREAGPTNLVSGLKAPASACLFLGALGLILGGFVRKRSDVGPEMGRAGVRLRRLRAAGTGLRIVRHAFVACMARLAKRWLVIILPVALIICSGPRLLARAPHPDIEPTMGPGLSYLSYLGGSGDDQGTAIATDSAGNAYVAGLTSSSNFPTLGAFQRTFGGGQTDAFICKISPTGKLIYSTYLGGSGQDNATSIAVDSAGNAYLAGFTSSQDFPRKNAVQGSLKGEVNAFVAKLDGAGSLVYSTYLGGGLGDIASSIAVDSSGNAYVAGVTTSADFPVASAAQPSLGGSSNGFITKLSADGSRLLYSTYLGGRDTDGASAIAVDSSGQAYIAGVTSSRNFPTVNALRPKHGGGFFDAFVAKLNSAGNQFLYSTYLGGTGEDRALRIAVDAAGNAYVTGDTDSTDFPTVNPLQAANKGSSDAFVAKLNPSGSALVYSTYLGGTALDGATGIAVDPSGIAYVTGFTASKDFPLSSPTQPAFGGGAFDAFVAMLSPDGSGAIYSSYLGGSGIDSGFGVASDAQGGIYVMGQTNSKDLPVSNALQPSYGGDPSDVFVARVKVGPLVTGAQVSGKKLLVFGLAFDDGAVVLLNGNPQKTANDGQSPATALVAKKAGKLISPGQMVTLQVQNSDGSLSNQFSFTRPAG